MHPAHLPASFLDAIGGIAAATLVSVAVMFGQLLVPPFVQQWIEHGPFDLGAYQRAIWAGDVFILFCVVPLAAYFAMLSVATWVFPLWPLVHGLSALVTGSLLGWWFIGGGEHFNGQWLSLAGMAALWWSPLVAGSVVLYFVGGWHPLVTDA